MRHRRAALGILGIVAVALVLPASAASAADANGCTVAVVSTGADGAPLDKATAPGTGGTQDDPFKIDLAGSVAYVGGTSAVITDATYTVTAAGVTIKTGTVANSDKKKTAKGTVDLSTVQSLKGLLAGGVKIPVTGTLTGTGGTCTVSGFVTGVGSATSSPLLWGGVGSAALGLALALWTLLGTKAAAVTAAAAGGAS